MTSKKEASPSPELIERATKALQEQLSGYYANQKGSEHSNILEDLPNVSLEKVLKMFRADSVAWGGLMTLLDRILENGYYVKSRSTGKRLDSVESFLKNKDFDFFLREVTFHFLMFNNAFMELVKTESGNIKEFHTIDPTQIEIHTNEHNEVSSYTQKLKDEYVEWDIEELLHVKDVAVELTQWGESSTKTLFQTVSTKSHIKKFMQWLFETNQFRGIHNIKDADELAIQLGITALKESQRNIQKEIVFQGEYDYVVGRSIKDLEILNQIIYKLDEEILNLLQVPPIYAGLPDNSNRSNSDAQERAFNTTIKAKQHILKIYMDKFLKKIGKFDAEFVFPPLSNKISRETIEVAQIMRDISVKKEHVADFLRAQGLALPKGEIFEEAPEFEEQKKQTMGNDTLSPSRRPKPEGEMNKQIGTGERGTTREDQLVGRSEYPYVYEALEEPQA